MLWGGSLHFDWRAFVGRQLTRKAGVSGRYPRHRVGQPEHQAATEHRDHDDHDHATCKGRTRDAPNCGSRSRGTDCVFRRAGKPHGAAVIGKICLANRAWATRSKTCPLTSSDPGRNGASAHTGAAESWYSVHVAPTHPCTTRLSLTRKTAIP